MTTIATGGFSNYNESIGFFKSASIETSAMIFIIKGSFPFIVYIKFLNGNKSIFFKYTNKNLFKNYSYKYHYFINLFNYK